MRTAGLIVLGIFSIGFMALGVLGLLKILKRMKSERGMRKCIGWLREYKLGQVQDEDEKDFIMDVYYPVYEYELDGEIKVVRCKSWVLGYQCRRLRRGHVLVDPETKKATCREDTKSYAGVLLTFGAIGTAGFVLMVLMAAGKLF